MDQTLLDPYGIGAADTSTNPAVDIGSVAQSAYDTAATTDNGSGSSWLSGLNSVLTPLTSLAASGASIYKTVAGSSSPATGTATGTAARPAAGKMFTTAASGSNTTLYVILGVVVLVVVGAVAMFAGRGRK